MERTIFRLLKRVRLPRKLGLGRGYTLATFVPAVLVASAVITGIWTAFADFRVQIRLCHAEREMDQYAAAALQELTNVMSWCWGAQEIRGGSRNPLWRIAVDDKVEENGQFVYHYKYADYVNREGMLSLSYNSTRGILIGGIEPAWARSGGTNEYVFIGSRPGNHELPTMDRRDRITIEGMTMDWGIDESVSNVQTAKMATVNVELVMQYRYRDNGVFGLYDQEYIRERIYSTRILMRNWLADNNEFRIDLIGEDNEG